jgi:hypothetical protein
LGDGVNSLTATGNATFSGTLNTGNGSDTLTFASVTFNRAVSLGDGNNKLTANTAIFNGDLTAGSGNDTINLKQDSELHGNIALGGGRNYIYVTQNLSITDGFTLDSDGETHLVVYNNAALNSNSLNVYDPENSNTVSVTYDWSDVAGLDKVRLLVSSDATFETFEFTVELYNQSKEFTLIVSDNYFIQFQAQDEDGWSHRILTDTDAPDQVTGFTMDGTTAVWDATHDNWGGNGVKQYNIQVSSTANFNSVIGTYTATDNSYDFSSFADGNYFIRIQAEDYTGNKGEWSNVENLLIDTQAPSKVTVSCSASKDDITVNWSSASDSASGVKEYNIEFSTTSSFATVSKSATVTGTTFSATDLADGTYYIRVQAVDNVGNKGAWSTVSSAIVDTTAPGVASNVKASQNSGTVSLSWSTANDSGVGVQKYNIQYSTSSNFNTITGSETVNGTSCNIQNLNDGTYYFRVQAVDKNGNTGSWSNTVTALLDGTAPTVPTELLVVSGTYSATLNWNAASDALSGVKEYEYIISSDSNFNSTTHSGKTTALNKSISDIDYGTYYCKVRAIDNYGNVGEWSTSKSFSIADATKPELTLSADTTLWTNQSVAISASAVDSESGIKTIEYSTDNKNWKTGSSVSVNANGTVYFRTTDNDGNVTSKSISVTNIDKSAPSVEISGNTATVTNQNVILSVSAEDSASGIKSIQYSFDNRSWLTGSTISVDSNKTVYVKVTDNAGNITEKSIEVNNIDKIAPNKPTASADITSATNQNVTVSAVFSSDSVVKQYSFDNKTWKTYSSSVVMEDNGTVYFRGKDEAGNYSTVTSYTVSNIDKVAPAKPEVFASTTAPTNKNVTVNAEFSLDSIKQQYSLDDQNWYDYESEIVFNRNGIVYFRGIDAAENISDVTEYRVSNIDKIAPAAPTASANINTLTNGSVIVTVEFSNDTTRKEFSYDGQTWGAYNAGIEMTANGILYFRGKDAAGNYSEITEYEVTNIDKIAPAKPIASANITAATNQSVTVIATFSNDTVTKEYSLDNKFWQAYTAGVVMDANGIVYFRAKDAAGNYSEITEYEVRNIDKVSPIVPTVSANITGATNQDVTVSATFSNDTVAKEYSLDNNTWETYTTGIVLSDNGTVYFRGKDEAGNYSEVTSYEVTNIDKVSPTLDITADKTTPTNQNVVLTATVSDGTVEYFANGKWNVGNSLTVTENGTYQFRVTDAAGNSVTDSIVVNNIDKAAPDKPTAEADITSVTNGSVTVSVAFSNDTIVKEYSLDNKNWKVYTSGIKFEQNGTVYFRAKDEADNYSEVTSYEVTNIDKVSPIAPTVSANITGATNQDVTVSATFSNDTVAKEYSLDNNTWETYTTGIVLSDNGTVYFRGKDAADNYSEITEYTVSNIDKAAPAIPVGFNETISGYDAKLDWLNATDSGVAGAKGYYVRYGTSEALTGEGVFVESSEFNVTDLAVGTYCYQVKTEDNAGNISEWSAIQSFEIIPGAVQNLRGDSNGLSWDAIPGVEGYIVEYSTDNFANVMSFETTNNKVDSIALPAGTYQWRVKVLDSETTSNGENITSQQVVTEPQEFVSNADGNTDVFFANANGNWAAGYAAQHAGILNGWNGTGEQVTLTGKNKLADIFEGSDDANILVMSDAANGDALFMDDIYTALPGTIDEQQARIAQIDEIRAGVGDDIVDMTSQRFEYVGDGVKIYGGLGNDTIWANNGNNTLFGDAGNDRIVGGANNDVIIGGIGNDSLHGGGGNDIFCFGGDWGTDTIEQLDGGEITLWFESGSENNWNADTLTYTDGTNSVKVSGISADNISLKFGNDSSDLYDELAISGCFDDAASEKIFEDKNKGMLA